MKLISIKDKLPKERQDILVRLEPQNENMAPTYLYGYLRYRSDKSYFFVIPGCAERNRNITHWIDALKPNFLKTIQSFELNEDKQKK